MFNTLKYAKILEEVGFSREQAETSIKILVEIMEDRLASKLDLQEVRNDLRHDIHGVRQELKQEIQEVRHELKQEIDGLRHDLRNLETRLDTSILQLKSDLTIRMGTMFAAAIALLTAIQKLV